MQCYCRIYANPRRVANYSPDLVFATAINEGAIAMKRALAASILSLSFLGGAQAATDTTTFKVLLVIRDSCTISTTAAVDVDFGTLDRTTVISNHDASGQLTVKCTPFTNYAIGLNLGANPFRSVRAVPRRRPKRRVGQCRGILADGHRHGRGRECTCVRSGDRHQLRARCLPRHDYGHGDLLTRS
jgi:hypothetical protein